MTKLKIAIVGRPNVGKSTLFNRLARRKIAIVSDVAGTTRDLKEYDVELHGVKFAMIDTAGFEKKRNSHEDMTTLMIGKMLSGVEDADILLFIVDARSELTTEDIELAHIIRKTAKSVILIANKSESKVTLSMNDIVKLGLGEPLYVSAAHGLGLESLADRLRALISSIDGVVQKGEEVPIDAAATSKMILSIVGRPNAGKSTLFNKIIGFERNIISEESGTTRDAIEYEISYQDQKISLIDTAGLRKKSKIDHEIEEMSAGQTITAIRRANVIVLVVDSRYGVEQQDLAIARMILNEGKGLVLVFNKNDLVLDRSEMKEDIAHLFEHILTDVGDIPVVHTDALRNIRVKDILAKALVVYQSWSRHLSTGQLNKWLLEAVTKHQPSFSNDGRRIKMKYVTQIKNRPPTFQVFVNLPDAISLSYKKYLSRHLQNYFHYIGTIVRFVFSATKNPYDNDR